MPFPWAVAAKAIPWTDVIAASPALARGARDLWKRIRADREHPATDVESVEPLSAETRIDALLQELTRLEQRAEAQAELLAQMAEQQEQLVAALDRQQRQVRIAIALAIVGVALALWAVR